MNTKENGLNQEINFTLPLKRMQRPTSSARKFQQKAMFVEIGWLQIWAQKDKRKYLAMNLNVLK